MNKILQLKITLDGSKPPIWRRFLVSENITFHELHDIIQEIMGWSDYHLYQFTVNNLPILIPHEDYDDDYEDSRKVKLKDFLNAERQKFGYLYDFGDSWDHRVVVERIMQKAGDKVPICIDGKMACPPEDCGGIYGYAELIQVINNKKHPEHKEMMDWVGSVFNPEELDINDINRRIKKANRRSLK